MNGASTPYGTWLRAGLPCRRTGVTWPPSASATASISRDLPMPWSPSNSTATWVPPWSASTADARSSERPVRTLCCTSPGAATRTLDESKQITPRGHSELREYLVQVPLHCPNRDAHVQGDVFVGNSVAREGRDLPLPLGQQRALVVRHDRQRRDRLGQGLQHAVRRRGASGEPGGLGEIEGERRASGLHGVELQGGGEFGRFEHRHGVLRAAADRHYPGQLREGALPQPCDLLHELEVLYGAVDGRAEHADAGQGVEAVPEVPLGGVDQPVLRVGVAQPAGGHVHAELGRAADDEAGRPLSGPCAVQVDRGLHG